MQGSWSETGCEPVPGHHHNGQRQPVRNVLAEWHQVPLVIDVRDLAAIHDGKQAVARPSLLIVTDAADQRRDAAIRLLDDLARAFVEVQQPRECGFRPYRD